MDTLNDLVWIKTGPIHGDCTSTYYIDIKKEFTLLDFIVAVLDNSKEYGDICIIDPTEDMAYKIEYAYGRIKSYDKAINKILNRKVEKLHGYGGWYFSGYTLILEKISLVNELTNELIFSNKFKF